LVLQSKKKFKKGKRGRKNALRKFTLSSKVDRLKPFTDQKKYKSDPAKTVSLCPGAKKR